MKKTFLLATLGLLALALSTASFAQCGSSLSYTYKAGANYITGVTNINNVGGVAYVIGKGDPAVGAGVDNGDYMAVCPSCLANQTQNGPCQTTTASCAQQTNYWFRLVSAPNYIIQGTTGTTNNSWDNCPTQPQPGADNITAVLWEVTSPGVAGHGLNFVAVTAMYYNVSSAWTFNTANTPQGTKIFQTVPPIEIVSVTGCPSCTWTLKITSPNTPAIFADNSAFQSQFYDSGITPAPVVISGWDIYWIEVANTATPTELISYGWNLAKFVALDTTAGRNYTQTTWSHTGPAAGDYIYFACRPRFANITADTTKDFLPRIWNGTRAAGYNYVLAANSGPTGPTAAGVFAGERASLNGNNVTVAWQSNVESNVATYEVYWAAMQNGPFNLASTSAISPKGNNSIYSVTFTNPGGPRGFYVKVRAVKMDGTYEDSTVMKVGGHAPIETPGTGAQK